MVNKVCNDAADLAALRDNSLYQVANLRLGKLHTGTLQRIRQARLQLLLAGVVEVQLAIAGLAEQLSPLKSRTTAWRFFASAYSRCRLPGSGSNLIRWHWSNHTSKFLLLDGAVR